MPDFTEKKSELAKKQIECDESLQVTDTSFNLFKQCRQQYYWRGHSKCHEKGKVFVAAEIKSITLVDERDNLASQLPEELDSVKSMHSNCMQQASLLKGMDELATKEKNIFYFFSKTRVTLRDVQEQQRMKCSRLEGKLELLQNLANRKP